LLSLERTLDGLSQLLDGGELVVVNGGRRCHHSKIA
jgi:hypothetical protein